MAPYKAVKRLFRDQPANAADFVKPAHPRGHVSDLVAINAPQNGSALRITDALQGRRHLRCHVEPPRLEHERHDSQPRKQIIRGRRSRFPQSVMSGQIAVVRSEIGQPPHQ